ncbi:unnamed protein product, partial [Didymodactylos carnosus]
QDRSKTEVIIPVLKLGKITVSFYVRLNLQHGWKNSKTLATQTVPMNTTTVQPPSATTVTTAPNVSSQIIIEDDKKLLKHCR